MRSKYIKNLLGAFVLVSLTACSGSGNCPPGTNGGGSIGDVTLKLTAPNQYPAGLPTTITAYLTMTNTSDVNATNLYYAIPTATNYTGVAVTVANDSSNPCRAIAAHQSCTFPVVIGAYANPGAFTVTATPSVTSQSAVSKLLSKVETKLGLQSGTLELTANIGLTNVPVNSNSGANGITFLYSSTIAAAESGSTLLSIVGVVNSASAGSFNTINLTDQSGNLLDFTVSSGNSGSGATNLAQGSIVTFLLKIPASATGNTFNFYGQTVDNNGGGTVNQGTLPNPINVGSATAGILVVQPTNFSLTSPNYESQVVTFTNIGNGEVSSLSIQTPATPLFVINNGCGSSLAAGLSCTYVLGSHATPGFSGDSGLIASYNNGSATASVSAQVHYAGANPVAGISVTSGDNPNLSFVANTESNSTASQLTLTNIGNVSESNFVFTVPQYFALAAGTTGTPCTLSGNTVTDILAKNVSCTLTLTYTNGTVTNGAQSANLLVDYKYNGVDAPQSRVPLTYETNQASGLLQVSSPALPYIFPTIRANGMSESQVFVYTNIGTGTATNITVNRVLQAPSTFSVVPSQPSAANDCGSGHITSLAPSASCQVTVKFLGSIVGVYNKTLQVSYESVPSATATTVSAAISGTVLPALSAKMIISSVVWSPTQLGGNGTSEAPFAFESSMTPLTVNLTYKNDNGTYAANNFTVNTSVLPQGFTLNNNGCNSVTLAINESCNVSLNYVPATATSSSMELSSSLQATWSDGRGSVGPMTVQWDNSGTLQSQIYYQIFAAPQVSVVMSYESDGTNPINSVKAEARFYVVYTLQGGYNVGSQLYGLDLSNAQGGTPPMTAVTSPATCTVSKASPTCSIEINSGGSAPNQLIIYSALSGAIAPTPTNSGNFNVTGRFAYVLGQDKIYAFDYNSTTGVLTPNSSISTNGSDSVGIVSSTDGKYLYVVDKTQSMIKSFAVNNNTGALTFIESVATGNGPSSGSLRFDPAGKYLYSSAVGAQNITVFVYDPTNGHLAQQSTVSSGVHPSFMSFTPNGKFAYVSNDVGVTPPAVADSARVYMYQVQNNGDLVALAPESSIQSLDNNPYSSLVDPSGKYLYVANVGPITWGFQYAATTVSIYDINQSSGALSYNATQNLAQVESAPVAIISDRLGKYMYVANAITGSISQFSASTVNGSLSPLTPPSVIAGQTPVSLTFGPGERFVYSVSQYGNFIQMYGVNPTTGQLTVSGSPISTGSPNQSGFIIFSN